MASFINTDVSLLEGAGTGVMLNVAVAGILAFAGNQPGQSGLRSSERLATPDFWTCPSTFGLNVPPE
jgi:hypothetical protein